MDNIFRDADGNAVQFERIPVANNRLTEQMGRPMFDEVILVHVYAPGSKDSAPAIELVRKFPEQAMLPERRASDIIMARFAAPLAAFLGTGDQTGDMRGTPLSAWTRLSVAQVAELNAIKVFTVEQLAAFPDSALQQIGMGARELREASKAFLAQAGDNSLSGSLATENDRLRTDNARLVSENSDLNNRLTQANAQIAALQGQPPMQQPAPLFNPPPSDQQPAPLFVAPSQPGELPGGII